MTDVTSAPASTEGKTLGIVGLILSFFSGPIGLIVSAIARSQSKKAGLKNGPATAGIVIGLISTIGLVLIIVGSVIGAGALASQCATLGPGVHQSGATTITCG